MAVSPSSCGNLPESKVANSYITAEPKVKSSMIPQRRNFRKKVLSHFSVVLHFTLNFTLLCKTTLEFTPILLHSDSHVDEILTISSSKIIQNPYSNTNK